MRSDRLERLARWGMGALLLLLMQCFAAPQSARAACTNHLITSRSERLLAYDRLDDLITGDLSATLAEGPRRQQPGRPAPRPCSGPGCKSSVPRPVSTASPSSAGPDQWIALRAVPGPVAASPDPLLPDEPADRPIGHRPSIFHPPPA